MDEYQLVNPDGTDTNWVYPLKGADGDVRWVWPLITYLEPKVEVINPFILHRLVIDVEPVEGEEGAFRLRLSGGRDVSAEPVWEARDYIEAVGTVDHCYHPNEIAADLFSKLVSLRMAEDAGVADDEGEADEWEDIRGAAEKIRPWADENFKPAPAPE